MADRIPLPVPGTVDLDAWGIPLTEAVNEHDTLIGRTLTGIELVTFASATSAAITVPFGITFPGVPAVFVNINTSAGATSRWHAKAYNITTVDFALSLISGDGAADAWTDIPVGWMAIYQP